MKILWQLWDITRNMTTIRKEKKMENRIGSPGTKNFLQKKNHNRNKKSNPKGRDGKTLRCNDV